MLFVYDLTKSEEWDRIVRTFEKYDVYYLSGYTRGFWKHGDGEPMLFYYEGKNMRGINVVMKRDISDDMRFQQKIEKGRYYDLVTPYGYGGWLLEGADEVGTLIAEYQEWCYNEGIISEFVRFHPMLDNQNGLDDFYEIIDFGKTIAMDLESSEMIWTNITSKNRNMIRKAQKNNLKVCRARNTEIYDVFKEIYDQTMSRDSAKTYYYFEKEFYDSVEKDLNDHAQVFYVQTEDGNIASAAIIIGANGFLNYHLSGSRYEYHQMAPTNLLLYEVALWGAEHGYHSFHMGGGVGSKEDSLYSFKKSFYRGEPKNYHIGRKVFNQTIYDELVDMCGEVKDASFFPKYRG